MPTSPNVPMPFTIERDGGMAIVVFNSQKELLAFAETELFIALFGDCDVLPFLEHPIIDLHYLH